LALHTHAHAHTVIHTCLFFTFSFSHPVKVSEIIVIGSNGDWGQFHYDV